MPYGLEVEKAKAIMSIAVSLETIAKGLKRLNDKLDSWSFRDSLAVSDINR